MADKQTSDPAPAVGTPPCYRRQYADSHRARVVQRRLQADREARRAALVKFYDFKVLDRSWGRATERSVLSFGE